MVLLRHRGSRRSRRSIRASYRRCRYINRSCATGTLCGIWSLARSVAVSIVAIAPVVVWPTRSLHR